jgi:hypothetical protein
MKHSPKCPVSTQAACSEPVCNCQSRPVKVKGWVLVTTRGHIRRAETGDVVIYATKGRAIRDAWFLDTPRKLEATV